MTLIAQVDDARVLDLLRQFKERGEDVRPALDEFGRYMVNTSIPLNFRAGGRPEKWPAVRRGGQPLRKTGGLQDSISHRILRGRTLAIGTARKGARLHHYGGKVRPKRAKALAIPVDESVKASPRRYKNTFVLHQDDSGDNIGLIVQKVGKDKIRPLFALRAKATIKARPFLVWHREDLGHAGDVILRHLGARP